MSVYRVEASEDTLHVQGGDVRGFPASSVQQIQFATIRFSKYDGINGLAFKTSGKKVEILTGLESPEANQILQKLSQLGVDTVSDPAMPMMVEMALARRKSKLG